MLVANVAANGIEPLLRAATITGLADGVEQTGLMDERRVELTAMAVAQMADDARAAGAVRLSVACAEPVRSVVNADELLDRIAQLAGTLPRVLSELDEVRISFRGMMSGALDLPEGLIAIEPGTSRTVLLGARDRRLWWSTTLPTGLAQLVERFDLDDPPSLDALHEIATEVERLTIPLAERHPSDFAVASGPLSTALGRLDDDVRLDAHRTEDLFEIVSAVPSEEICERAQIASARATLLGPVAAVIDGVRRAYRLESVEIVEAGLREGLLLEAAGL
jgi:exopolyphosphatase/pppGpp-phosphohydrolase